MGDDGGGRAGVILDVDGTLLDTNYLHAVAWARAFRGAGHDVPMSSMHRAIGMSSDKLVHRLLGHLDDGVVEGHSKHYETFQDEVRAFPRVPDLIRELRGRGLTVVIVTSGAKKDLEWMLPAIGVEEDELGGVLTSSDVDESKPSPDPFATALDKHRLDPARTVAVGDTVWDVEAALRAEVGCVALTCGGIDERTLRDAGAAEVYDDPAALLDAIDDSLLARLADGS
jgi:HAD superfamily hydrolase (TIGR01509 family)